jgi:hypothetical protein
MTDSGDLYTGMDVDDDLSTVLGTETLADKDMMLARFENTTTSSSKSADALPVEVRPIRVLPWKYKIQLPGGKAENSHTLTLSLWALGSTLAMSTECGRVFSRGKCPTPKRNALADNTLEATECLKLGGIKAWLEESRTSSFVYHWV